MQKSNVDIQFDNLRERYDRVIDFLKGIERGSRNISLPLITNNAGKPEKVFTSILEERTPLILSFTKTIALWHLMQKSNVDIQFDNLRERYDRVIDFLKGIERGSRNISLPLITNNAGKPETMLRYGSNPKFSDSSAY